MKENLFGGARGYVLLGAIVYGLNCAPAVAVPFSDFDDGSIQGWTPITPFEGTLSLVITGGNPGGWLRATDTLNGGGGLLIAGPAEFSGDLSVYEGVSFDEIVLTQPGGQYVQSITPILRKANGVRFMYYGDLGPTDVWRSRYVSFDPDLWVPYYPGTKFENVIHDCTLVFDLDCWAGLGPESGIDNFRLVPEPSMGLFGLVGVTLLARRRRTV